MPLFKEVFRPYKPDGLGGIFTRKTKHSHSSNIGGAVPFKRQLPFLVNGETNCALPCTCNIYMGVDVFTRVHLFRSGSFVLLILSNGFQREVKRPESFVFLKARFERTFINK